MRRKSEDIWGRKRATDWFDDKTRPEGRTIVGDGILLAFKDVDKRMARNNTILYFLLTKYNLENMRVMMVSTSKTRDLVYKFMVQLQGSTSDDGTEHPAYAVTQEWAPVFRRDLRSMRNRTEHVFRIICENLVETELYPYFEAVGFDKLIEFASEYSLFDDGKDALADQLQREIEEWNADHQEEIKAHMEKVAPLIAARDAHRQKVIEDNKAEKRSRRIARQLETAEVREIRENTKRRQKEERRANRMFARYWS